LPAAQAVRGTPSLASSAAAALAAMLLRLGWPAPMQFAVVGGGLGIAAALAAAGLRPDAALSSTPSAARFAWPRGRLLWIGLLILAGLLAEGAMYDWSVLYLQQHTGLSQDRAALGYAAFAAAMAAGRFGIDRLRRRFSDPALLASGALLATFGMAGALLSPHPAGAIAGFALAGAGLAPVVPLLYTAASRVPGPTSAAALAAASSIGYAGMLIGPPLIGLAAEFTSLATALWIVVLALGALTLGSWRLKRVT
jgi:predicted MFS family arabinose efflux permease